MSRTSELRELSKNHLHFQNKIDPGEFEFGVEIFFRRI